MTILGWRVRFDPRLGFEFRTPCRPFWGWFICLGPVRISGPVPAIDESEVAP